MTAVTTCYQESVVSLLSGWSEISGLLLSASFSSASTRRYRVWKKMTKQQANRLNSPAWTSIDTTVQKQPDKRTALVRWCSRPGRCLNDAGITLIYDCLLYVRNDNLHKLSNQENLHVGQVWFSLACQRSWDQMPQFDLIRDLQEDVGRKH